MRTVDLTIPKTDGPSRLDRGRSSSTGTVLVHPDDLATVDAKTAEFWTLYPAGIIDGSDVEQIGEDAWKVTVRVWKDRANSDGLPDSAMSATRSVDLDGHVSGEFALETAQSAALARSLRFLGILATIPNAGKDTGNA